MNQKYQILLCEADTGIVLKNTGERWLNPVDNQSYLVEFDAIEEALSYKDNLLNKFPFGEVSIVHGDDETVYRDEENLKIYLKERTETYRWIALPFFVKWFKKKPNCKIYKDNYKDS